MLTEKDLEKRYSEILSMVFCQRVHVGYEQECPIQNVLL